MIRSLLAIRCLKNFYYFDIKNKRTTTVTTIRSFYRTELLKVSFNHKPRYNYLVKNTLQNWFLNQIELSSDIKLYKREEEEEDSNILELLKYINKLDSLENTNKEFESKFQNFDTESCKSFSKISDQDVLTILNKLTRIAPNKITRLEFYKKFIDNIFKEYEKEKKESIYKDNKKLVNIIFLIGLKKRNGAKELNLVLNNFKDFFKLSLIEKAIVSSSAFKCGVKLDRDKINQVEDSVNENIKVLLTAPQVFVSLIKVLRHAGPSAEFSLNQLSRAIIDRNKNDRYRISIAVPLLALYAEMLEAEINVIERLIDDCIYEIANEGKIVNNIKDDFFLSNEIRIKDIDRMIWAVSRLNYKIGDRNIEEIDKFIKKRFSKLLNKPETLCGMLLSMWIIGYERLNIIEYCFDNKIFNKLLLSSYKNRARLNLLIDCIRLERPDFKIPLCYKENFVKLVKIKPCKELIIVCKILKFIGEKFDIKDTEIECPIESLRIYGVTTKHKILGLIHLDILNEITCLRDGKTPNGLMSLKLRLVEAMGYNSIILDHGGLTKMEDTVTRIEICLKHLLEKHKNKNK